MIDTLDEISVNLIKMGNDMSETIVMSNEFPGLDFLGSRNAGEIIREKMDEIIAKKKLIILDFNGILSISQSFGDEIIGIYVRAFGVEHIKNNIEILNANDEIREILNFVVKYSKKHFKAA